jgi:hypothetical protein
MAAEPLLTARPDPGRGGADGLLLPAMANRHLLIAGAPAVLVDTIEQVVRLLLSLAGEAGHLLGGRTGRSIARGLMGGSSAAGPEPGTPGSGPAVQPRRTSRAPWPCSSARAS